jgi:hypothetical protein
MADKKKAGSLLMASLGRTKKEQMKALTPPSLKKSRTSTSIKSKGPYIRGTIGKKSTGDFLKRRAVMSGVDARKAIRKADREAARTGVGIAAATGAGYALGRYGPKKTEAQEKPKSHRDKARQGAKELIKKQKAKKEKHHSR